MPVSPAQPSAKASRKVKVLSSPGACEVQPSASLRPARSQAPLGSASPCQNTTERGHFKALPQQKAAGNAFSYCSAALFQQLQRVRGAAALLLSFPLHSTDLLSVDQSVSWSLCFPAKAFAHSKVSAGTSASQQRLLSIPSTSSCSGWHLPHQLSASQQSNPFIFNNFIFLRAR